MHCRSPTMPAKLEYMTMAGRVDHIGPRRSARNGAIGFNTQIFWYNKLDARSYGSVSVMVKDDEDPHALSARKPAAAYEMGQSLDDMSLEEIGLRIEMLRREIDRLEQARQTKEASRAMAAAFFKT
jgi:uncharacterized small protein (DUF1192 family)